MSRRQNRMADLIREQVSLILVRDVRDPRIRLASVSRVDMSSDLRHARVAVSVLGGDEERSGALDALERASGYVRSRLAADLRSLRVVPELRFELDRGAEHSQRISDLLEALDDDE